MYPRFARSIIISRALTLIWLSVGFVFSMTGFVIVLASFEFGPTSFKLSISKSGFKNFNKMAQGTKENRPNWRSCSNKAL